MAIAANMAKMRPVSTGWRLPQIDRIAVGIVDAGEPADAFLRFYLGNLDARGAKALNELIEAVDAQVEHHLPVGREIIGVRRKGREDRGPGLLLPHAIVAAADAEVIAIPFPQSVRIARPEEQAANSSHCHLRLPRYVMGRLARSAWANVPSSR